MSRGRLDAAMREAASLAYNLREEWKRKAKEACFNACIKILEDPKTSINARFRAMKMLEDLNLTGKHRRPRMRFKNIEKPQPLSDELVREVMETANRELGQNGHQN